MSSSRKVRLLLVLCESLAGTGHKVNRIKPKGSGEKLEFLYRDPIVNETVLYREIKKLKTLSSRETRTLGFD